MYIVYVEAPGSQALLLYDIIVYMAPPPNKQVEHWHGAECVDTTVWLPSVSMIYTWNNMSTLSKDVKIVPAIDNTVDFITVSDNLVGNLDLQFLRSHKKNDNDEIIEASIVNSLSMNPESAGNLVKLVKENLDKRHK